MIFTFDNKIYSNQPPPNREILYQAVGEASDYCESISREIKKCKSFESYKNIRNFYSDCFTNLSKKIQAIKKIGSIFRNEVNSISRDLTEIIIDGSWVWYYFEIDDNKKLAELLCKQFYINAKAHFISEFEQLKILYLNNPFLKDFYNEEKLDKTHQEFKQIVGSYKYQQNWRRIPKKIDIEQFKWKARCEKAATVMEKYAKLRNADLYRNLSLLSSFSHWDSLQIERVNENLEEATFNSNLNVNLGLIHDMLNLGYNILQRPVPENLRYLRQRIIW